MHTFRCEIGSSNQVMLPHCGLSEHTFWCGIGRWKEIQVQLISNATRYYYSASSWASHRYLLLDERTEYFEWLCTVRSRCFGLPPGLVSLGGNSAFLSGHEAGSVVGYLCVKWVRMLVKSPQSCAFGFAMVPTLMVLTPLVNSPR